MATSYHKTMRQSINNWTLADHERFDTILNSLPIESYPNGNCGCKDRQHHLFTEAGFVITKQDHGDAANMAFAYFDLA